ncbi:TPA: RasGEF domain-containing protein, partial [Legionella anisa]
ILFLFSKLNLKIEKNILRIKKKYTEQGITTTSNKLQALEQLIKALESQRIKFLNEKTALIPDKEINDINFLEAFIRDCQVLLKKNADIMPLYNLYKKNIPHFKQLENQAITDILQNRLLPLLKEYKNKKADENFLTRFNKPLKKIQAYIDDTCNRLPGFFEDEAGLTIKKMLDEQFPEWESQFNNPHIPLSNELSNLRRFIQKKIDEEITNNLDRQPIDGIRPDQAVTLPIQKDSSGLYGLDLESMLKEMEYLVQNEHYKTYGINCAETVRRIVNAGLSHLNTKLHKNNILAISTPQTLMHEAISIGSQIIQLNYQKIRETIRRNKPFDFLNLLIRKKDHLFGHLCSQGELPSVEFDRLLVSQGKNIPYRHKDYANCYKQMEQTLIFNYVNIFEKLYKKEMGSLSKKEIKKLGNFFQEKTSDCFENITELDAFTQSFVFYDILVHKRSKTKVNAFRRWLDIAQVLLEQESYAPFFAIINALNSPEISHYNLVSYLPNSYQNRFHQFIELCSPEHGYKNARKNLDLFSETSLTPFQWFSKETMNAYGHNSLQENDNKGYSPFAKIIYKKVNCLRNFNDPLDKYQMRVVKKIQKLQKTEENNPPKYVKMRSEESKQNLEEQSNKIYYRDMFFSKKTLGQSRNKKLEGLFKGILQPT